MGRNADAKLKIAYVEEENTDAGREETLLAKARKETGYDWSAPGVYTHALKFLLERNRKRVSTYYCPNTLCGTTFWDARKGYECPACKSMGIISEFRHTNLPGGSSDRSIVGYVDSLGRLICSRCILDYGVQGEIGLIVYNDTEPFCFEECELCREPLGRRTH